MASGIKWIFLLAVLTQALPGYTQLLPDDLDPWREWLVANHDNLSCPWQMSEPAQRICTWPGQLELELRPRGLTFRLAVEVFQRRARVALPGDSEHWPDNISIDGERALPLEHDGVPNVFLDSGRHIVRGEFSWRRRPAGLGLPTDIALVTLREAGRELAIDRRKHRLIFSPDNTAAAATQRDSLTARVYRKLEDGVPMLLETRLELSVSGKPREVRLGQLGWPDTELVALRSPLPARLEPNGDLRIQLVAGNHTVITRSRLLDSAKVLRSKRSDESWPATEYLSFAADPGLRQVKFTGAASVDTSQVEVPAAWQNLPTYLLDADSALHLATEFRGDHTPSSNRLTVQRELWLDFDGDALTGVETISGAMHQDWRLDAAADTQLGRAEVAGHPVLVTTHAATQGIEVRSPDIQLTAVTRIPSPGSFSAVGWAATADSFAAQLHIPPGWRVLHASGVDEVGGSWVSRWNLWAIFLLLIIAAATRKLLGTPTAILASVALVLGYHETGMPIAYYPTLLLAIALLPLLSGGLKRVVSVVSLCIAAVLVLSLLSYAVVNFRLAIYPTLERGAVGHFTEVTSAGMDMEQSAIRQAKNMGAAVEAEAPVADIAEYRSTVKTAAIDKTDPYRPGDNDRVQTGPGAPTWLWRSIQLRATGPVAADRNIQVRYSPPWLTSIWRLLSVLLATAYAAVVLVTLARRVELRAPASATGSAPATLLMVMLAGSLLLTIPQSGRAADYPPEYLLDEMERRLLQPPDCLPDCVSLDQGRIDTTEHRLSLSFVAYADTEILLPLPTAREGWQISQINIDGGSDVAARQHQQHLAIRLPRGEHLVSLSGKLFGDSASISLPLPIHNITIGSDHWLVSGLIDGRSPSGNLSLHARASAEQQRRTTLTPDPITPFVIVHREFYLDTQWRMITRVVRVAPAQGPLSVQIPLLEFEQAVADDIPFRDGQALVEFGNRQREVRWQSFITPTEKIQLRAAKDPHYVETWRLLPSALWRLDHQGIPPVKPAEGFDRWQPLWRPWPGEQLAVSVSRPAGVPGATATVEAARLDYQSGDELQRGTLTLTILASLAQDYTVGLPEGAEVLALRRNQVSLNRPLTHEVTVGLQPGEQTVIIEFQQQRAAGWLHHSPRVMLPGGASNISLSYDLPRNRWPLYLTGPAIGPAMLYWGVFCVILLGALLLPMLGHRLKLDLPLGAAGWLLLGIGLSTVNSYGVLLLAAFFFALAYRRRLQPETLSRQAFNGIQVALAGLTLLAAGAVLAAIPMGLLSSPDMFVTGNGSWSHHYNFFQDRANENAFPTATVVSVSLVIYRLVMLLWSLWLANRLIRWAHWWWRAFSAGGAWRGEMTD